MCVVVSLCGNGAIRYSGSPTCTCSLEYVRNPRFRIGNHEEVYIYPSSYVCCEGLLETVFLTRTPVREQDNDGDAAR